MVEFAANLLFSWNRALQLEATSTMGMYLRTAARRERSVIIGLLTIAALWFIPLPGVLYDAQADLDPFSNSSEVQAGFEVKEIATNTSAIALEVVPPELEDQYGAGLFAVFYNVFSAQTGDYTDVIQRVPRDGGTPTEQLALPFGGTFPVALELPPGPGDQGTDFVLSLVEHSDQPFADCGGTVSRLLSNNTFADLTYPNGDGECNDDGTEFTELGDPYGIAFATPASTGEVSLYVTHSHFNHARLSRISAPMGNSSGNVSVVEDDEFANFQGVAFDAGNIFGGALGGSLYVADPSCECVIAFEQGTNSTQGFSRVPGAFAEMPDESPVSLAFSKGGDFGHALYVLTAYGNIYRLAPGPSGTVIQDLLATRLGEPFFFRPDAIDFSNDGRDAYVATGDRILRISALDTDDDGVPDSADNCDATPNSDQADGDHDGIGDACDTDFDNDGVLNAGDNCPLVPNPDQADNDNDGIGDTCDPDDDNDGVGDEADNCVFVSNTDQLDTDGDGVGNSCDPDDDNDAVIDPADNCPLTPNTDQADADNDGIGNACDTVNNGIGRFVAFSRDYTWLRADATVVSGDVGANQRRFHAHHHEPEDGDRNDVTVRMGQKAEMQQAGSKVVGSTVLLLARSVVYDVVHNFLIKKPTATVLGNITTPMSIPYLDMPAFPTVTPGTTNKTVAKNQTMILGNGTYGKVEVKNGGTLILTGGLYQLRSLDLDQGARVLFRAPTQVRIKTELHTRSKAKIVHDPIVPGLSASQMVIYVEGDDNSCGHGDDSDDDGDNAGRTVVHVGTSNVLEANIYAKNGTVWLKSKTNATGAFIGQHVRIGTRATLTLSSAF
jgi:hypothetical protein